MIEVGTRDRFAIAAEPREVIRGWILGGFQFWLGGEAVGNWDDAADLRGCVRWLVDFAHKPRDRYVAGVDALDAATALDLLHRSAYGGEPMVVGRALPPIPDAFRRCDIRHLGMSSFDDYDLMLVTRADGTERCLWRRAGGAARECILRAGEMEEVAAAFCSLARQDPVLTTAFRPRPSPSESD